MAGGIPEHLEDAVDEFVVGVVVVFLFGPAEGFEFVGGGDGCVATHAASFVFEGSVAVGFDDVAEGGEAMFAFGCS